MINRNLFLKAIATYSRDVQKIIAIEELAELQHALCKSFRENNPLQVEEEIGDVIIMIEQLKIIYNEASINNFIKKKMERLEKMLDGSSRP